MWQPDAAGSGSACSENTSCPGTAIVTDLSKAAGGREGRALGNPVRRVGVASVGGRGAAPHLQFKLHRAQGQGGTVGQIILSGSGFIVRMSRALAVEPSGTAIVPKVPQGK